jgi:hypothetical protein
MKRDGEWANGASFRFVAAGKDFSGILEEEEEEEDGNGISSCSCIRCNGEDGFCVVADGGDRL